MKSPEKFKPPSLPKARASVAPSSSMEPSSHPSLLKNREDRTEEKEGDQVRRNAHGNERKKKVKVRGKDQKGLDRSNKVNRRELGLQAQLLSTPGAQFQKLPNCSLHPPHPNYLIVKIAESATFACQTVSIFMDTTVTFFPNSFIYYNLFLFN